MAFGNARRVSMRKATGLSSRFKHGLNVGFKVKHRHNNKNLVGMVTNSYADVASVITMAT